MNRSHNADSYEGLTLRIREHLQKPGAQERIRASINSARTNATVTTSRAAKLLDLGEQQLRDWEKRGLISTTRPLVEGKQTQGHRQFSLDELDRLAVMKELIDEGKFTPGEFEHISSHVEEIWREVEAMVQARQASLKQQGQAGTQRTNLPIDVRVREARSQLFWRFYVSRALHLALQLIREDRPASTTALALPLAPHGEDLPVSGIENVARLGESLIGWLGKSRSTETLLAPVPSFEVSSDYRIHPLMVMERNQPQEEQPLDYTHIIVRRDSNPLSLYPPVVETIRKLLKPIYEKAEQTRDAFGPGMRDELVATTNLDDTTLYPDIILNGMSEMMVEAGGLLDQKPHWRFCCILLPNNLALPMQNRTLVVRAQSQHSPHKIGVASVPPNMNSLSMHAYQSGQICYRNSILPDDSVIAFHDVEGTVKSAIAIPVGAEFGEPVAIIYLVSVYENAFSQRADRLILRLLGRMVGEAVRTYQARLQEAERLASILRVPDRGDEVVGAFYNENKFIHDLENFLLTFKADQAHLRHSVPPTASSSNRVDRGSQEAQSEQHTISLIGIDVDHLSAIALKYGNTAVRNLCREIGFRLNGELKSTFVKYPGCHFYRIYGDCFYVLLKNMPYDQVLKKAVLLKKSLDGTYRVNLLQGSALQQSAPGTLHEVEIKVRLAVSAYDDQTLAELFARYPDDIAVDSVREMIDSAIMTELKKGMSAGGDRIRAWNPETRTYQFYEREEGP
jgi:GGDEF domain-containing protein/DNA-binding transcriptional MerR regulator